MSPPPERSLPTSVPLLHLLAIYRPLLLFCLACFWVLSLPAPSTTGIFPFQSSPFLERAPLAPPISGTLLLQPCPLLGSSFSSPAHFWHLLFLVPPISGTFFFKAPPSGTTSSQPRPLLGLPLPAPPTSGTFLFLFVLDASASLALASAWSQPSAACFPQPPWGDHADIASWAAVAAAAAAAHPLVLTTQPALTCWPPPPSPLPSPSPPWLPRRCSRPRTTTWSARLQ